MADSYQSLVSSLAEVHSRLGMIEQPCSQFWGLIGASVRSPGEFDAMVVALTRYLRHSASAVVSMIEEVLVLMDHELGEHGE